MGLDHFLLYSAAGPDVNVTVQLEDQWHHETVKVLRPIYFANPVKKTQGCVVTEYENPEAHLVFYEIVGEPLPFNTAVVVANQLVPSPLAPLYVSDPALLAVPSQKIFEVRIVDLIIPLPYLDIIADPIPPGPITPDPIPPGVYPYLFGTVVNLSAPPLDGYQFVEWTGDVETIADVNAANTTITLNGDYFITPNYKKIGGGCFIATAAYGTPMAEEIEILREFRDEYLLTNPLGQALTDLYYRVSPPIAEFITEHPGLKPLVRAGLVPAVAMSAVVVNTTVAEKIAIIGLVALVSVALAVWATRRRGRSPEHT